MPLDTSYREFRIFLDQGKTFVCHHMKQFSGYYTQSPLYSLNFDKFLNQGHLNWMNPYLVLHILYRLRFYREHEIVFPLSIRLDIDVNFPECDQKMFHLANNTPLETRSLDQVFCKRPEPLYIPFQHVLSFA